MEFTVTVEMEYFSTEYKSHVPPEFSRFNSFWPVNYKYSDHKAESTEKKNRLEGTHTPYIFSAMFFPNSFSSVTKELHKVFHMELIF